MNRDLHLSVVATSRNDDHGGNLLFRMQHFVDGFIKQCLRHGLSAELILVEWNPPAGRPSLRDALKFPESKGRCQIRIITVPDEVHNRLRCARELPLFQMIAKNVGIRRARGKFVLATNIDILFSDEIICYLRDRLATGHLYRADRFDIPSSIPTSESFETVLSFCRDAAFRVNRRTGSFVRTHGGWKKEVGEAGVRSTVARTVRSLGRSATWRHISLRVVWRFARRVLRFLKRLPLRIWRRFELHVLRTVPHTNACGDFTLLSYEDWCKLRGYPEWEIFSWHVDSMLLYQAMYSGIKEIDLPDTSRVFHIEHGVGSGYTPEGASVLFARLDSRAVPYLDLPQFEHIVLEMKLDRERGQRPVFNDEKWGFAKESFPEQFV